MEKIHKLHMLYKFATAYLDNPRVSETEIHKKFSDYKSLYATCNLLKYAQKNRIIVGPYIYCNSNLEFSIRKNKFNPIRYLREIESKNDPTITHAIALGGAFSFLCFSKGGSGDSFVECIMPSPPGNPTMTLENLYFDKPGKLKNDIIPSTWDLCDWKIYNAMRTPTVSYSKVGRKIGVSWMTIRRRFQEIIKDCKVLIAFFPRGYKGYSRLLATFKTDYEIGLEEALKKVDRSSYLWKFDEKIILTLFVDNYNDATARLYELENMGLIFDLYVSTPIRYFVKEILDFPCID